MKLIELVALTLLQIIEKLKELWKDEWVRKITIIVCLVIALILSLDWMHKSDQEALDYLGVPIELSDADYEYNDDYYWKGENFYYKMFVYGSTKEFTLYRYVGDKCRYVSFENPIELYKLTDSKEYKFYKQFIDFLESRK